MTFSVTNTPAATELTLINKLLLLCGLRPVSSATSITPESDAYYAQFTLHEVIREELQKGWFCYNKFERYELIASAGSGFGTPYPVLRWSVHVDTRRAYPDLPKLKLESNNTISALNFSDYSKLASFAGKPCWFDFVFQLSAFSAPAALLNYCVYKAATMFAPMVGAAVDPDKEKEALGSLMQLEAQCTPRSNVFHDEYNTLMTWADR